MAEKPISDQHGGSGSDRSPSLNEKPNLREDPLGVLQKVPDPDEGLSEEERHKLVSRIELNVYTSLTSCIGPKGHVEGGPLSNPMALFTILDFLPGSNKYRKRENRRPSKGFRHDK